ncbi:hypothetical protein FACS189413_05260 [Bacteroidia bacterium]|nr:hypothetical protein FACS189413_05260 [Bacteroidia bacterium]
MKKKFLLLSMLACSFTIFADKTIYVDPVNGSDLKNGLSWENAIKSISSLPGMVPENELTTVYLKENSLFEEVDNVDFGSKNINLVIEGNHSIIKGKYSEKRMFRVAGPESVLTLKNTTFRDKFCDGWNVGAAIIYVGKEITVDGCQFINNSCQTGGAALACRSVNVTVRNSYFKDNKATITTVDAEGGAIKQSGRRDVDSYLLVENCTFEGNTVAKGDGSAIGFYDRTSTSTVGDLCEVKIFNCVFFENKSLSPTSSWVGAAVHFDYDMNNYGNAVPIDGVLVNNTFYGQAPAVSLENKNKLYFINNVAVNYDNSSTVAAILKTDMNTDGRQTTKAYNNFLIGTRMPAPGREKDFVTGTNGNVISQTLSDFSNLGLDDYLTVATATEPFFVPYQAIYDANSPLIDRGLPRGQVYFFGEEIVPASDIRGNCSLRNGVPDIGAYEWNAIPDPNCGSSIPNMQAENEPFMLYQTNEEVMLISKINGKLNVRIVNLDGTIIAGEVVKSVLTLNKKDFTPGVKIITVNDGKKTVGKKVIF